MTEKTREKQEDSLATVGGRLRALRGYAGLSRADIEREHGIPVTTLKSWETSPLKNITKKSLQKITILFNEREIPCTVDWIISGEGPSPFLPYEHRTKEIIRLSEMSDDPGEAYFEFFGKFAITHRMDHDDLDPHFSDEDLLGGQLIDIGTLTNQLGSSFIFKMHDDSIVVGFLANGTSPGKFTIVQDMSFSSDNSFIIDADFKEVYKIWIVGKNGW